MPSRVSRADRRQFLELAIAATASCSLRSTAWSQDASALPGSQTLPASAMRVLVDNLDGPEGPTLLPDGRVAFVARPGNVIAVGLDGRAETLASSLGLVVGTALGRSGENVLYVCKMDISRLPRPPGGPPPGAAPPAPAAGDSPGGAILKLDLTTKKLTPLYTQCDGRALVGPNKLLLDRWGDLWITDVLEGALYWARADGSSIRRVVSPLPGAHGITLSPDRRTLYVSSEEQMVAFTIKGRGQLEMDGAAPRRRLVARLDPKWRVDGIRTEAGGNVVLACWGEGLIVLSPDGKPVSATKLSDLSVANLVFGGADRRTIYATVSEKSSDGSHRGIGKIVSLSWPRPGLPPAY